MMFAKVRPRVFVYALVSFSLLLLAAVVSRSGPQATVQAAGPLPTTCRVVADGKLRTGDRFLANVNVTQFGLGNGTVNHFLPWRPGQSGACTIDDQTLSDLCFENERAGGGAPGIARMCATRADELCVRDHFQGTVSNADCLSGGTNVTASGSGSFNGIFDYTFDISFSDHTPDFYNIFVTAPDERKEFFASGDVFPRGHDAIQVTEFQ